LKRAFEVAVCNDCKLATGEFIGLVCYRMLAIFTGLFLNGIVLKFGKNQEPGILMFIFAL